MNTFRESTPRLVFLVTEDWYFWSHRLPIARAARDAGARVVVAARVGSHAERIAAEGFTLAPIALRRRRTNPFGELAGLAEIVRLYRQVRPDLVHHVALKPVVYGSVAARLAGVPAVVNALGGLGFAFTGADGGDRRSGGLGRVARWLLRGGLRIAGGTVVVQNGADAAAVRAMGVDASRIVLIRGSGVDTQRFAPTPEPATPVVATLVARMLWDKGVGELVEAARLLQAQGLGLHVRLVGSPDPENPASIDPAQLRAWDASGHVRWTGPSDDVPAVLAASHIAVLPSYREGLPKSLLEAAACGRPIVATDVPGCREIVRHGENGLLVPARDPVALAEALRTLALDPELRARMGRRGRELVEAEFSEARVVRETLALYRAMLGPRWPWPEARR